MQYFNIPVTSTPGSADNPLGYITKLTRPEDFVMLKIDIDHSPTEQVLHTDHICPEFGLFTGWVSPKTTVQCSDACNW